MNRSRDLLPAVGSKEGPPMQVLPHDQSERCEARSKRRLVGRGAHRSKLLFTDCPGHRCVAHI